MSNVVLAVRVWATKDAAETAKASSRNAVFLRMRALRGVCPEFPNEPSVSGIVRFSCPGHNEIAGHFYFALTHIYQQSKPQRDQPGSDGSFFPPGESRFPGQVLISPVVSMGRRN